VKFGDPRLPERLWSKIDVVDGCWIWRGAFANTAQIWRDGKTVNVRRWIWETEHGRPAGDAVGTGARCDRRCVHHDHAVAGSRGDLADAYWFSRRDRETCRHGHVLAVVGVYTMKSKTARTGVNRACRACQRIAVAKVKEKRRRARIARMSPERLARYNQRRAIALAAIWSGQRAS